MKANTYSGQISIEAKGFCDIHNITDSLQNIVDKSGFKEAVVCVICPGSTGGITTCEYEPGLTRDIKEFFDKLIPEDSNYHHNQTWHDGNGFSHMRATLLGPSLSLAVSKGRLVLGTWQQVIFIDFDNRTRSRKLFVQIIGGQK
jgi:secondary thiamine-phosphate synthase enzyme